MQVLILVMQVMSLVRIGREWPTNLLIAVRRGIANRSQLMLDTTGRPQCRLICVDDWVKKTYLPHGNKNQFIPLCSPAVERSPRRRAAAG